MATTILFLMLYVGPIKFKQAANWFIAGATIQSLLGIWQFLSQSTFAFTWLGLVEHPVHLAGTSIISSPDIGRWLRAYGALPHPNIFGGYLVISIILTVFLLLKKTGTCYSGGVKTLLLYYLTLLLQVTALFFTFSRSTWLAFVLGLFVFAIVQNKKFKTAEEKRSFYLPVACALFLIATLTTMLWPIVNTRFAHQSTNEIISTTERIDGYEAAWSRFTQNPWFGIGAGNFTFAMLDKNSTLSGWQLQPPHNALLLLLVELGFFGLLLFLITVITFVRHLTSLVNNKINYWKTIIGFLIPLIPIIFLDHYIFSSFTGLLLATLYPALIVKQNQ